MFGRKEGKVEEKINWSNWWTLQPFRKETFYYLFFFMFITRNKKVDFRYARNYKKNETYIYKYYFANNILRPDRLIYLSFDFGQIVRDRRDVIVILHIIRFHYALSSTLPSAIWKECLGWTQRSAISFWQYKYPIFIVLPIKYSTFLFVPNNKSLLYPFRFKWKCKEV